MKELRYTLVSDGSSDRALLPILTWLLIENRVLYPIQAAWADLRWLPNPPKELSTRIRQSLDLYPCELLFVHRDAEIKAEKQSYGQRKAEIISALANFNSTQQIPSICVVPIRMMEAWLLFNEAALRRAAGNPNGIKSLDLPHPTTLEQLNDPKNLLYKLLKDASELTGRKLSKFRVTQSASRVAGYIDDFSILRKLSAFRFLESDIKQIVMTNQWASPIF